MFRALLSKEIKLILRDGYALLVLFLMPIVFVLIMSFSLQEVFESENNSVALKIFTTLGDETSAEWGEDLLNLNGFDTEIIKNTQTLIGKAKKQVMLAIWKITKVLLRTFNSITTDVFQKTPIKI